MAGELSNNIFDTKTFNNLKRVFLSECQVPATIYAELTAADLAEALFSYERPDPKAIYDRTFGHAFIHDARGIARKIGLLGNPSESKVSRFAADFLSLGDLIPYYVWLIGLGANFLFNWSSDIIQSSGCQPPLKGNGGGGYAPFGASFDGGRWGTFDFWFDGPIGPAGPPGVVLEPGQNCMIAVNATATSLAGEDVPYDARIYVSDTGAVLDAATTPGSGDAARQRLPVWAQYHHGASATTTTLVEWQCTYFGNLPDHELFPGDGSCFVAKW